MGDQGWPTDAAYTLAAYGGGTGGTANRSLNGQAPVSAVEVWTDTNRVRGMRITYWDGMQSAICGHTVPETYNKLTLARDELVSQIQVWSSQYDNPPCVGWITIVTNKGQRLDLGGARVEDTRVDVDCGSGVLMGIVGRFGDFVDQIGFPCLRSVINKIVVSNVSYQTNLAGSTNGITPQIIGTAVFNNNDTVTTTWHFTHSVTRTNTTTFEQSCTTVWGASVDVEVTGKLWVVELTGTLTGQWESGQTTTSGRVDSTEIGLSYGTSGTIEPGETKYCQAVSYQGVYPVPYTSTVTLLLMNGDTLSWNEPGTAQDVAWSAAYVTSSATPPATL